MTELNLVLEHLRKSYLRPVLTDVNLQVTNDSYVTIMGKSGSGKSTLLNILGLASSQVASPSGKYGTAHGRPVWPGAARTVRRSGPNQSCPEWRDQSEYSRAGAADRQRRRPWSSRRPLGYARQSAPVCNPRFLRFPSICPEIPSVPSHQSRHRIRRPHESLVLTTVPPTRSCASSGSMSPAAGKAQAFEDFQINKISRRSPLF